MWQKLWSASKSPFHHNLPLTCPSNHNKPDSFEHYNHSIHLVWSTVMRPLSKNSKLRTRRFIPGKVNFLVLPNKSDVTPRRETMLEDKMCAIYFTFFINSFLPFLTYRPRRKHPHCSRSTQLLPESTYPSLHTQPWKMTSAKVFYNDCAKI